jgi:hypothetical protein
MAAGVLTSAATGSPSIPSAYVPAGKYYPSITEAKSSEPFELQVARGLILGHSSINIFAFSPFIESTQFTPMWELPNVYNFPPTATTMTVASTSTSDTAVVVRLFGLDVNFNPITETVALNGTTGVATVGIYFRINSVITVSGNAIGDITVTNAGIPYAKILAGDGRTKMSIYSVPAGYTFYLNRVDVFSSVAGGSNNHCMYRVKTNSANDVNLAVLQAPFTQRYEARRVVPFAYTEMTDIQWQCKTDSSTAEIGIVIEGVLVRNNHEA